MSVLVIARNEEKSIGGLLDSVRDYVAEIILIDGCSHDRTREIAYRGGANVYIKKAKGYPEADRLYGLSKCTYEWVLLLDADERPSTFLMDRLFELSDGPLGDVDAYWIPRVNYYDDRHQKRTWGVNYPDLQLRLFRKSRVSNPGGIHEHLRVAGAVRTMEEPARLIHLSPGLYDLRRPHNKWIRQAIETTPSQGFLYHAARAPASALYFAYKTMREGGWRDKWIGVKAAVLLARFRFLMHTGLALKSLGKVPA